MTVVDLIELQGKSESQIHWGNINRKRIIEEFGDDIPGIDIADAAFWMEARNVKSIKELEELANNHNHYSQFLTKYPSQSASYTLPFLLHVPDNLLIVDTETSGIAKSEVIEIAAMEYRTGNIILDGLICPRNIDKYKDTSKACKIHGITKADLIGQPTMVDLWQDIYDALFSGRYILASFNSDFDARMIHFSAMLWNLPVVPYSWVCIMKLATTFIGSCYYVSLDEAARYLKIEQTDSHRALADVITTRKVLRKMELVAKSNERLLLSQA